MKTNLIEQIDLKLSELKDITPLVGSHYEGFILGQIKSLTDIKQLIINSDGICN